MEEKESGQASARHVLSWKYEPIIKTLPSEYVILVEPGRSYWMCSIAASWCHALVGSGLGREEVSREVDVVSGML